MERNRKSHIVVVLRHYLNDRIMVGERPTWCWANYWHLSCFGHDSALCFKRASMVANVRRDVGWIPGTESASTVSVPRRSFCWMSSAFVLLKSSSATIYASQLRLILDVATLTHGTFGFGYVWSSPPAFSCTQARWDSLGVLLFVVFVRRKKDVLRNMSDPSMRGWPKHICMRGG